MDEVLTFCGSSPKFECNEFPRGPPLFRPLDDGIYDFADDYSDCDGFGGGDDHDNDFGDSDDGDNGVQMVTMTDD